jgi:hypothetical protein
MPRFGVREVANVTFYNLVTGKPELFLDSLKMSNMENNADTSYAVGGQGGGRLVGWDYNRTVTFNIQDALLNPKALAMQSGVEIEKKIENIFKREHLSAVADTTSGISKLTLEQTPVAGTITIYKTSDGYEHEEEVSLANMTISGNTLTFPDTDLPVGEEVLVYYQYQTTTDAEVIVIKSDKFSSYYMVVGDTLWRNEKTGQDEMVQIVIPKAKIVSKFTLTMQPDGDPSVFDFDLDVFKAPNSTDMVKIVRY